MKPECFHRSHRVVVKISCVAAFEAELVLVGLAVVELVVEGLAIDVLVN
jgi:hypothetical protein